MKRLKCAVLTGALIIIASICFAQKSTRDNNYAMSESNVGIYSTNITKERIPLMATTTIVSPEKIKYVDISTKDAHGELSGGNIFRLRVDSGAYAKGGYFEITIVTSSFIAVYQLFPVIQNSILKEISNNPRYMDSPKKSISYVITVNPNNAVQVNQHGVLSERQSFDLALQAMKKKPSIKNIKAKQYGLEVHVNNIFTVGDYLMFDISLKNKRNLQFDIDQVRFKIIDKKLAKATVSQDIELQPVYSLYPSDGAVIQKKWRNFYILKKFTYPSEKYLQIEITEKQISGRKITINVDYNQILKASVLMYP